MACSTFSSSSRSVPKSAAYRPTIRRALDELVEKANCRRVDIPEDPRDLKGLVKAVAEAERCAIDVYNDMLKDLMSVGKDPITFHTIRHIMGEEVHHEEEMENLLGL